MRGTSLKAKRGGPSYEQGLVTQPTDTPGPNRRPVLISFVRSICIACLFNVNVK